MQSVWARIVVPLVLALLVGTWAPARLVGRDADAVFDGRLDATLPRALALAREIEAGIDAHDFTTGSARYDGEWALVTHQMAVLALGQVVLSHAHRADVAAALMPAIRRATDVLLSDTTRAFATDAWGSDALLSLDDDSRGDAWLGYVALALGMSRAVDPEFAHAAVHDAIVRALRARIDADPEGLPETYPGETYPPDVAACAGAIGLHARVTGEDASLSIARWAGRARAYAVDPESGWLRQSEGGVGRGSGTALAIYFLAFADRHLAAELFDALGARGVRSLLGFAAIREHAPGSAAASGDVDSGPVLLGVSVAATGFSLAGARLFGERALFRGLHRTASLFGAPAGDRYVAGGALGDAILLAMETAGPLVELTPESPALAEAP